MHRYGRQIPLRFPQKRLATYDFGKSVYEKQIKPYMTSNYVSYILFPSGVDAISISFVKGMMEEIIEEYGIDYVTESMVFSGLQTHLVTKIRNAIEY